MRRILIIFLGLILVGAILWWLIAWAANGGWPSAGPIGDSLPTHITYVRPADGEEVAESYGFCAHFYYQADHGLGDEPYKVIRYYLDGRNVTRDVVDLATHEYGYPDPEGEPCYRQSALLRSGWHTAKVTYVDLTGERFTYTWRFLIRDEAPE